MLCTCFHYFIWPKPDRVGSTSKIIHVIIPELGQTVQHFAIYRYKFNDPADGLDSPVQNLFFFAFGKLKSCIYEFLFAPDKNRTCPVHLWIYFGTGLSGPSAGSLNLCLTVWHFFTPKSQKHESFLMTLLMDLTVQCQNAIAKHTKVTDIFVAWFQHRKNFCPLLCLRHKVNIHVMSHSGEQ